jgi:hypothetical protein
MRISIISAKQRRQCLVPWTCPRNQRAAAMVKGGSPATDLG